MTTKIIENHSKRKIQKVVKNCIFKAILGSLASFGIIISTFLVFWYKTNYDILHYVIGWFPIIILLCSPIIVFIIEDCKRDLNKTKEDILRFKSVLNS